jgi:hypothetical protein
MFAFALCLFAFLATAGLARPAERESSAEPRAVEQPLCGLVRSAASAPQLEEEESARPQEEEIPGEANLDQRPPIRLDNLSQSERLKLRADRELFESFLVNWRFFEDLAPRQRAIVRGALVRCGAAGARPSLAPSVFGQWNASQRATFVGITHAMLNTQLMDSRDGKELGDALQLVEELLDIYGENSALPSDKQFQLIVRLTPDAGQKLERAAHFEKGENHIFHKEFPISFRQFRRIGLRGREAGLHICVTRDGRLAQIHIDYRFGLLHLGPANSDVRADGNHERHVDRWPVFDFAVKRVQVRRIVLH